MAPALYTGSLAEADIRQPYGQKARRPANHVHAQALGSDP